MGRVCLFMSAVTYFSSQSDQNRRVYNVYKVNTFSTIVHSQYDTQEFKGLFKI